MIISQKEYKKAIDALPSFEDTKKTMLKNDSAIPERIKVGARHYLDSNHWIDRNESDEYVGAYINLVGGKIGVSSKTLKDAIILTVSGNEEMIALGRPK